MIKYLLIAGFLVANYPTEVPPMSIPAPVKVKVHSPKPVVASWYGPGFNGRKMANGRRYDMNKLTVAHKTIKLGTKVKITANGKSVIAEVTDRGPFIKGRELDTSKAIAIKLGFIKKGLQQVYIEKLS